MSRQEYLVFEVGSAKLGIPLSLVEEVVPAGQITPLPKAPPFLLGLSAVRGKVMSVIDASLRYNLGPSLKTHFVVCRVRGNLTAVAVDRPVTAGAIPVRELPAEETAEKRRAARIDEKFVVTGFALLDEVEGLEIETGEHFLEVRPDLFVSAEMALRTGEV